MSGYIYIRCHPAYDMHNACLLSKTTNMTERDYELVSNEFKRGHYNMIIEVPIKKLNIISQLLQYEFSEYNIYLGGGTEFYDKQIMNMIEPYLIDKNIPYRKLSSTEITNLSYHF